MMLLKKRYSGTILYAILAPLYSKMSGIILFVLLLTKPVFGETLAVPCVNGGGSGGWMFKNLPDHYFPLGLIKVNESPVRSIKKHPMYVPNVPTNKYGTCVIVPAKYP